MDDSPPRRLLDPGSPTPPRLRGLLQALVPSDIPAEVEERLEERLHQTLAREPEDPAAPPASRSTG